jgi:hypothetical protein
VSLFSNCKGLQLPRAATLFSLLFLDRRFVISRFLLATPHLLRCCLWVPARDLAARVFGQGGGQALEEVLAGPPHDGFLAHGVRLGGVPRVVRPVPRYGPPPSSLPLPVFASGQSRPSTSRHARSLLEGRLVDRPNLDSQALQLALGELGQAMRRAEVRLLPRLFASTPTLILFFNSGRCSSL